MENSASSSRRMSRITSMSESTSSKYNASYVSRKRRHLIDNSEEQPSRKSRKTQQVSNTDPERQRILYMPNLGSDINHHDVFERFCIFGDIKQVYVRKLNDEKKYATILFTTEASMRLALVSNPHELRGKTYNCIKIGFWRLGLSNMSKLLSTVGTTSARHVMISLPNGVNSRYYQYQSMPAETTSQVEKVETAESKDRLALLPASSVTLLSKMRKSQATKHPKDLQSKVKSNYYRNSLMSGMGRNFTFVRHSYTDYLFYQRHPGHYYRVPINACIRMTALGYAAQRDRPDLTAAHYVNGSILKK